MRASRSSAARRPLTWASMGDLRARPGAAFPCALLNRRPAPPASAMTKYERRHVDRCHSTFWPDHTPSNPAGVGRDGHNALEEGALPHESGPMTDPNNHLTTHRPHSHHVT